MRVVMRHGVVGLVHDGLSRAGVDIPSVVKSDLKLGAATLVHHNLALAAEALRVQASFDRANVPLLFLKGPALAALVYGALGLRDCKDLDILVSPDDLNRAGTLLETAGYARFEPPLTASEAQMRALRPIRKDYGYSRSGGGDTQIELHWRLFRNPHLVEQSILTTAPQSVPMATAGAVPTLNHDALFAYLCAHGAIHWWRELKWMADIGAILSNTDEAGIERMYRFADNIGLGRVAALAILLSERVLGTVVPPDLSRALRQQPTRWLEATVLKVLTAGGNETLPRARPFGTTRGSFSTILLRKGLRYRVAETKLQLTSQEDVLAVPMPQGLAWLYPALRLPLWLFRQMSKREIS